MSSNTLRFRVLAGAACASWIAACATQTVGEAGTPPAAAGTTGTVVSVDTSPWAYDGHAVVQVDTTDGRIAVKLPARWNPCQARPVEIEALEPGTRVQVVGERDPDGGVVVCSDASHGLQPVPTEG